MKYTLKNKSGISFSIYDTFPIDIDRELGERKTTKERYDRVFRNCKKGKPRLIFTGEKKEVYEITDSFGNKRFFSIVLDSNQ